MAPRWPLDGPKTAPKGFQEGAKRAPETTVGAPKWPFRKYAATVIQVYRYTSTGIQVYRYTVIQLYSYVVTSIIRVQYMY